ncbi:MAG: putative polymerase sigma (70) factor [Aeromicrobium sp.]|jgi:hypothetical protein|nr:putative polymerase sigma (70) factor [Aeromicrobium sp.]
MMDEIEAFRQLRDHATPPADEVGLARAREQLTRQLSVPRPRLRRGHLRRRVVAVTGLVAAASAVTLGLVTVGNEPPRADAAAVTALTSASDHVLDVPLPVTAPGQYLLRRQVQVTWGSAGDANRAVVTGSDGEPVVWATERTNEVWIPHDPTDEWVVRERSRPSHLVSKDAAALAGPTEDDLWKAPNGIFGPHWRYAHPTTYERRYADHPRDPEDLLAFIESRPSVAGGGDAVAFGDIGDILREGAAPADLRAALYQALALIPRVTLVSDSVNLAGQAGVAIGYPDEGQLIFDPQSGAFIGERDVSPDFPAVPGLGKDKVTFSTVVTIRVVDTAPVADASTPRAH